MVLRKPNRIRAVGTETVKRELNYEGSLGQVKKVRSFLLVARAQNQPHHISNFWKGKMYLIHGKI
jgi:hypothetical protein